VVKNKVYIVLLLVSLSDLQGQSYSRQIYDAFIDSRMDRWESVMEEMEEVAEVTGSRQILYELVVARYGYIAYCISMERDREAKTHVKKAEEEIETLLASGYNRARVLALQGAVYGYKVGLAPYKAVIFGRRALDANKEAMELSPRDPQIIMEKANIELYKPTVFGDAREDAVRHYKEAIDLYEENPEAIDHNWLYLNALSGLASAYIETEHYREADEVYRKILRIEPGFKWIREEVYPEFREKYME